MFDLNGKCALVTGGASGIGLATVQELLKNGIMGVSIIDSDESSGLKVTEDLKRSYGDRVIFIKADITCKKQFKGAFEQTVTLLKCLDIVINNAGIVNEVDWEKMIDVNFKATVRGTYMALNEYLPKYRQSNEGVIVNISSTNALHPSGVTPVYGATKRAILGIGQAFGCPETYQRTNVKVVTICPGPTTTQIGRNSVLSEELLQMAKKNYKNFYETVQSAECVGKAVVKAIQKGQNGSVFVVEESKEPYEIAFPKREELKTGVLE